MDRKFDYPGLLIAAGFFVLFAAQLLMLHPTSAPIAYSDFHQLVAARLVDDLEVGPVSISGTLKMPQAGTMLPASEAAAVREAGAPWRFTTSRVADEHLTDTLTAAGIRYHGAPDTSWIASLASWLLPLVLFVFIWNMMLRRRGGLQDFTGMGKSRARVYVQQET
ncbi:cell division protein FtsH, partial [Burkholderia contaminans]